MLNILKLMVSLLCIFMCSCRSFIIPAGTYISNNNEMKIIIGSSDSNNAELFLEKNVYTNTLFGVRATYDRYSNFSLFTKRLKYNEKFGCQILFTHTSNLTYDIIDRSQWYFNGDKIILITSEGRIVPFFLEKNNL